MVKFQLNKQLDIEIASDFLGTKQGGVDFGKTIWSDHPELKDVKRNQIDIVTKYFDKYYEKNTKLLEEKLEPFQEQWNSVEKSFLNKTIKLFNGFSFPKGKYIGYISSFDCNPRFLEDKTFQICYKYNSSVDVTSHELLHFIFFDYTTKYMKDLVKDLKTYSGLWWDVSEVFNTVVLGSNKYIEMLNLKEETGYPNHKEYIVQAKELYSKNNNIDKFITYLFSLIGKDY